MEKKIYIVHSDKKIALSMERSLMLAGLRARLFTSGEEAMRVVGSSNPPAVVLLDLLLQDMPGLVLMYGLKSIAPSTECIIVSEENHENSAEASVNLGAFCYLLTPCSPKQLLVSVRGAIAKHELENKCNEYEERIREISEFLDDCVYIIDRKLKVHYVNAAACRFLDQSQESIIGKPLKNLFDPKDLDAMTRELKNVMSTGKQVATERTFVMGGKDVILKTMLIPVRSKSGEINHVQGISRCILPDKTESSNTKG